MCNGNLEFVNTMNIDLDGTSTFFTSLPFWYMTQNMNIVPIKLQYYWLVRLLNRYRLQRQSAFYSIGKVKCLHCVNGYCLGGMGIQRIFFNNITFIHCYLDLHIQVDSSRNALVNLISTVKRKLIYKKEYSEMLANSFNFTFIFNKSISASRAIYN